MNVFIRVASGQCSAKQNYLMLSSSPRVAHIKKLDYTSKQNIQAIIYFKNINTKFEIAITGTIIENPSFFFFF